jgi:oligoribonuclease NrnB/cAMP/cGMP phosphodiesterase (DHH superfamily)
MEFPWELARGKVVWMVDFSLQPFELMHELNDICYLYWIDHHKSAIANAEQSGFQASGGQLIKVGTAGCELTHAYLHPHSEMPVWVYLLGRYDVWDHKSPDTLPFQYGMRLRETDPERSMEVWDDLLDTPGTVRDILNDGRVVLKYVEQRNASYIRACAFDTVLDGLRCIAVNRQMTNSQTFDSVWDPEKYDAMLTFGWRRGQWTVSLYSVKQDVDVSEVAVKHGGGGHKGAAGFQCTELPFRLDCRSGEGGA